MKRAVASVAFLVLAARTPLPAAQPPVPRPNILRLIANDPATRLGCYGDRAAMTPNLLPPRTTSGTRLS